MNKEQLLNEIEQMPIFVLRDIATNKDLNPEVEGYVPSYEWKEQEHFKAVTEKDNTLPLTFVTKKYKLIQFREVYKPLIENIPELEGDILYFNGFAIMDFFPVDETLKLNGDKIGLVAINSVNKQSSVIIKFCVEHKGRLISIPKKIAGLKRVHSGKVFQITQNFLSIVDKIKSIWGIVLSNFQDTKVDKEMGLNILQELDIKENYIVEKVKEKLEQSNDLNLWDMFVYIIEQIEKKNFKSDLHRRKKLDTISEKIFKYATISKLLTA